MNKTILRELMKITNDVFGGGLNCHSPSRSTILVDGCVFYDHFAKMWLLSSLLFWVTHNIKLVSRKNNASALNGLPRLNNK